MDPFHLSLANGPLALYLLRLAWLNFLRRPVVITGSRERIALGLALGGYVIVGPMQLFMPDDAATRFGPYVWLLMLTFYSLCLSLWNLLARPRLSIYNALLEEVRPVLLDAALAADSQAQWLGNNLSLPQLNVHLHAEEFRALGHLSLVATAEPQSPAGWRRFEDELHAALAGRSAPRSRRAAVLALAGGAMLAAIVHRALDNPQALVQGLRDMLQL